MSDNQPTGHDASTVPIATLEQPSPNWIELDVDGLPRGSIALDFKEYPELIVEVHDDDIEKIKQAYSDASTTAYSIPLPIDLVDPTAATDDTTPTTTTTPTTGEQSHVAYDAESADEPSGGLLPLRWYGSKLNTRSFILNHLPDTDTYVEPFSGAGTILLNRAPSCTEVLNDIDSQLIRFFRVLRAQTEQILEQIAMTPFSREELTTAIEKLNSNPDELDDITFARCFFTVAGQTRAGLCQQATPGRWAYTSGSDTSRRGMAGNVSRYWGRLPHLQATADRLRRVQLESKDALYVIEKYDHDDALFYLDPPYPHSTRNDESAYQHEYTEAEHRELASTLHTIDGLAAISSYSSCKLYDDLFLDQGWTKVEAETHTIATGDGKEATEALWLNYDPAEVEANKNQNQSSLTQY